MNIDVKILDPEFFQEYPLPAHATEYSAGVDLRAAVATEQVALSPGETVLVPTGLAFAVPESMVMLLVPRSGLGHKHGVVLGNLTGVIDSDYRGEVMVSLWNRGTETFQINRGERICQALFVPFQSVILNAVEDLSETARGAGGFSSTGAI